MNGPVANAGSTLYLFNSKGINVPKIEENMITEKIEMLTIKLIDIWYASKSVIKNIMDEHANPFIIDIKNSRDSLVIMSDFLIVKLANPWTTIADDWTPTLPPIAAINGMKKAISKLFFRSNSPIICAPIIPPIVPIINQGNLDLVIANILSLMFISSNNPEAIW